RCDAPPLAGPAEARLWAQARAFYERICRVSQWPRWGAPLRAGLAALTAIPPLHPERPAPTLGTRALDRLARIGLGRGLSEALVESGRPLLTTFFAPAITAQ